MVFQEERTPIVAKDAATGYTTQKAHISFAPKERYMLGPTKFAMILSADRQSTR